LEEAKKKRGIELNAELISSKLAPCDKKLKLEDNLLSIKCNIGMRSQIHGVIEPLATPRYGKVIDPT
jgi:hypothetical protein